MHLPSQALLAVYYLVSIAWWETEKKLRKFFEVKGVLSIVLGDGWESQLLYVVSCTEYSLYRLYIPEGGTEQSVTARQGT